VRGNTRFISSVEHDISRVSAFFQAPMYFSVYYINKIQWKTIKRPWQCVLQQIIFSHVKIPYFLRVFKYDFSQWPKTLYNTYVYIIKRVFTGKLREAFLFWVYHSFGISLITLICIFEKPLCKSFDRICNVPKLIKCSSLPVQSF
jgi:hypothetical protein